LVQPETAVGKEGFYAQAQFFSSLLEGLARVNFRSAMGLTSDPHAWLRPYVATLKADPAFATLAMPLRFAALCDVVGVDHPDRARWMKEWSPAAPTGTLHWLESVTKEERAAVTELELWAVTKGKRKLRCVARYLPIGIDLRLMERDDFRRTELHKDADLAEIRAMGWRQALEERGWR
jgi:hypothetical protein